jgi:hypothetical protein
MRTYYANVSAWCGWCVREGGTRGISGRESCVEINADADGDDAENLNGEYVIFKNTGSSSLDLSGWVLADAADHSYTIPEGTILDPGDQITIYTGSAPIRRPNCTGSINPDLKQWR